MKALIAATTAAVLMTLSGVASADEPLAQRHNCADQVLAQKNNCIACHAQDLDQACFIGGIGGGAVGPSFKKVAAKYRGDTGAEARLFAKVKTGGKGVWGPIPMPPQRQVEDADLHKILQWILSLQGPTRVFAPSTR